MSRKPVISVGNLAMGGRGKTPVVAEVGKLLVAEGERPAILSRGYARRDPVEGVVIVSDGTHRLADLGRSGDEPLMLARQVPGASVLVCEVRATAAAVAEEVCGATVHVLDDGFQHRSLARDVDIVLVTLADLKDRRLPFGRLRSPVRALSQAHAVIVDGASADEAHAALKDVIDLRRTSVFTLTRSLGPAWWVEPPASLADTAEGVVASGTSCVVLAGIAGPARFVRALESAGYVVARVIARRDHHSFTRRDLREAAAALAASGASVVVTTEKDAMRLLPLRPLALPVAVVPLQIRINPAGDFADWLRARVEGVRSCAS